jgi:hypothetical protein
MDTPALVIWIIGIAIAIAIALRVGKTKKSHGGTED